MNRRLCRFWILALASILPLQSAMAWGPHGKITETPLTCRTLDEAIGRVWIVPESFRPCSAPGEANPPQPRREKASDGQSAGFRTVACEGSYPHHLQGICVGDQAIFWSFTTMLVKTGIDGKLLKKIPVANHHGDPCFQDGKLYVAVNLGKFNDPQGNADSWVYVYNAGDLSFEARHPVQEVFHGAGGIGFQDGRFFVVGGLPMGIEENYVYEYDPGFRFIKKHVVKSGHTLLGIQTATFALGRWWFGCYGTPQVLLVTDAEFRLLGRYEFDCSMGIVGLPDGRFLVAGGRCEKDKGCTGSARLAVPDEKSGLRFVADE